MVAQMQTIKRVGVAEDIVGTICFLTSDDCTFLTRTDSGPRRWPHARLSGVAHHDWKDRCPLPHHSPQANWHGRAKPPDWSEELALTALDRAGVVTAVVSIWGPGVHFGDDPPAWALARKDERVRNRPGRAPRRPVRPVRLGAAARRA